MHSTVQADMKILCVFISLLSASVCAAAAPDSLSGKVYRTTNFFASTRTTREITVVFRPDGRFIYLKDGTGSSLNNSHPRQIFLNAPKPDGTYVYRRTGPDAGTVDLAYDDGTTGTLGLDFSTDSTDQNPQATSFTSELAALESAPARNISMRGNVVAGRPLIAGFVLPGAPVTTTNFVPRSFDQIVALQPSLLLIDLVTGERAGWELLERLHEEARTRNLPVIVASNEQRLLDRAQGDAKRYGGKGFLIKPMHLDALLDGIRELIGNATEHPRPIT